MAISSRLYIFDETGAIKRVPRRIQDALVFGKDAIPEYASTRQRIAQVLVENENGKPTRIIDAQGSYWTFDEQGQIDQGLKASLIAAVESSYGKSVNHGAKVVDLRPELKRKEFKEKHRWDLTVDDLNRIAADLWPHLADAEEIKTVKGKASKRPPLTHEAEEALADIQAKVSSIYLALDDLSEPALKGLAYEASRMAKICSGDRPIWTGVAQEAEKRREIKARHRTGKGVFYALLHVWHQDSLRERTEIDTVEVQCTGKKAAIEAARQLLAENAHRFSEDITLEAEVVSDLEWDPIADERVRTLGAS